MFVVSVPSHSTHYYLASLRYIRQRTSLNLSSSPIPSSLLLLQIDQGWFEIVAKPFNSVWYLKSYVNVCHNVESY